MRFLNNSNPPYELTYSDVFMVPSRSDVGSRMSVDLRTNDGTGTTIPLVVANMTAVAGRRMAETIARRGGMAILPQDVPADIAAETIANVKKADLVFDTPITVKPHHTVGYARNLIHKRAHGAAIVLEGDQPVGIVTDKDLEGADNFTQVGTLMSTSLLTLPEDISPKTPSESSTNTAANSPPSSRLTAHSAASSPAPAPCAPPCTSRLSTPTAACESAPPSASTATSKDAPKRFSTPAPTF